jgi:prepilin-type N-terminal cleavage/methylation domain-containing protein
MLAIIMRKSCSGFTILEVLVVVALIGFLTAIVVPHVLNARNRADQKTCISNLRQIDQAIQQWAAETKALPTDVVIHKNLVRYMRKLPTCPSVKGGTFFSDYGLTFVKEAPYCVVNISLASTPHIVSLDPPPIAARGIR